jgi:hypothetical protein
MILVTKLHIPQPRSDIHVERPSIIEMLNEGLNSQTNSRYGSRGLRQDNSLESVGAAEQHTYCMGFSGYAR